MHRLVATLAVTLLPAAAHAGSNASGDARISLVVPEICQLESPAITVDANGDSASGTVFEMCNSGRSFRVVASHRTLVDGEQVHINYGGATRQLDRSGVSDVAQRDGPTVGDVPVTIQADGLMENLTISLGLAII